MAVFLFVIISPLSVYAAGDSASENESNEEYESWEDAFEDEDYTDNLIDMIARYWASTYENYVGTGSDVIEDVSEMMGNQYDNTVSFYENLYNYILPISRQAVINATPGSLSTQVYGKPIRNKNNLKLIQDFSKTVDNNIDSTLNNIASKKNKNNGLIQFDELPDKYYFAIKNPIANLSNWNSAWADPAHGAAIQVEKYTDGSWCVSYATTGNGFDISDCISEQQVYVWFNGTFNGVVNYFLKSDGNGNYSRNNVTVHNYSVGHGYDYGYVGMVGTRGGADCEIIYGSCYINRKNDYDTNRYCYYWNQDDLTLTLVNMGYPPGDLNTNGTPVPSPTINNNIIYSVNIDDFNDLVNQLMLDVNMSNTITNSLLIELLTELRNQRDVYQPTSDDDDIYNYIDYMMNKLLEVKDVHIEIPDITPDLGGIADALTALLNFLASIIRTLGNIVTTLLEGLFHLFVPSETDWDEINIQFDTMTAPLAWIKEFISEAASNISILLFGRNVTDFEIPETEDVENVSAGHGTGPEASGSITATNIVFDPNGAPKIPVRFSNSTSEYFSGIEDAYIIDMSWYTPYKPVGDIIVVAFCWIFFVWRVLHGLPGIINGATGSEDIKDDAHTKVNEIFLR